MYVPPSWGSPTEERNQIWMLKFYPGLPFPRCFPLPCTKIILDAIPDVSTGKNKFGGFLAHHGCSVKAGWSLIVRRARAEVKEGQEAKASRGADGRNENREKGDVLTVFVHNHFEREIRDLKWKTSSFNSWWKYIKIQTSHQGYCTCVIRNVGCNINS